MLNQLPQTMDQGKQHPSTRRNNFTTTLSTYWTCICRFHGTADLLGTTRWTEAKMDVIAEMTSGCGYLQEHVYGSNLIGQDLLIQV